MFKPLSYMLIEKASKDWERDISDCIYKVYGLKLKHRFIEAGGGMLTIESKTSTNIRIGRISITFKDEVEIGTTTGIYKENLVSSKAHKHLIKELTNKLRK